MRDPNLKDRSFCDRCGNNITPPAAGEPSTCSNSACGKEHYSNPIPVNIVLQPVVLRNNTWSIAAVRKLVEPAKGLVVLPGGYDETYDDWRFGAADELKAEACIDRPVDAFSSLWLCNASSKSMRLHFSIASPIHENDLPVFDPLPNAHGVIETCERLLLTDSTQLQHWSLHAQAFDYVMVMLHRVQYKLHNRPELFPAPNV